MGKVQGDKKLNTPAINARSVKTRIPDSGRLDFGANGLNGALSLDIVFRSEDFSIELVLLVDPAVSDKLAKDNPASFRTVGKLSGANELMKRAIFLGTYPGLNSEMLDFEIDIINQFAKSF